MKIKTAILFGLLVVAVTSIILKSWVPIVVLLCVPMITILISVIVQHKLIEINVIKQGEHYFIPEYDDEHEINRKELN